MSSPAKHSILYLWSLLASLCLLGSTSFARDLYWTENKQIMASDIDGGDPTLIFDGATSTPQMDSFAVDIAVTATHIYWSGHNGGDIWRADRDGNNAEQLFNPGGSPHFLEISEATGKIYFSDFSGGLYSANSADGSSLNRFFSGNPFDFSGLALDTSVTNGNDELLWISASSDWLFRSVPAMPSTDGITQLDGGGNTYGLAFDGSTNTVYYTNLSDGTLRSYNLTTDEGKRLKTGLSQPLGVKLSPAGTHLLIAERGRGVSAFQIDNFGYELLVESSDAHFGVAVTANPADLPPGEDPGNLPFLFRAHFEGDSIGGAPVTDGASLSGPGEGSATVIEDTGNDFGYGEGNKFLRVESARNVNFSASFEPKQVVTVSFDYIGRVNPGDGNRWLNVLIRGGSNNIGHITSIRIPALTIRPDNVPSGDNDTPLRFDTILNNSSGTVTYDTPNGATADLSSGQASLWVYSYLEQTWTQLYQEYIYNNALSVGVGINNLVFQLDNNTGLRSFDLDNVYVFEGASVGELAREADVTPPPPPPFLGHWELDFEGIPTGEITPANAAQFIHGNLTSLSFNSEYDLETADPARPLLSIGMDVGDIFGEGTANQILQTNGARGWTLMGENNFNEEVMTLRMDMIHHGILTGDGLTGQIIIRHFDGADIRLSQVALRAEESPGTILGQENARWDLDVVNRFEVVMNNSADSLTYTSPMGTIRMIDSGATDMWINGTLVFGNHTDGRAGTATPGPIMKLEIKTNSSDIWNADISQVRTYPGVQLVAAGEAASPYRLQSAWTLAPADRSYMTDGAEQRGLAYNPSTGHLIVPDRGTAERPMTVAILDGATGNHVGTLSTTGISGGTFDLNHVAASSDGAIYGANLSTDTISNPLKVYRWANESAEPVLVFEGDPSEGDVGNSGREVRFGDTMDLRGSGMDTQILMAPRFGVNPIILTPDGSMDTFGANRLLTNIPTEDPAGLLTHGLAFGEGDTFFAKRQPQFGSEGLVRPLAEVGFDTVAGTGVLLRTYDENVFPNGIGPLGIDLGKNLLIGVDSDAVNQNVAELRRPAKVMLFDLGTLSDSMPNLALDAKEFGPSNSNGNGSGQVVFGNNDMVYVLDTSNGITAFNIVTVTGSEGFAAWQDLQFPNETAEDITGENANPSGDGVANLMKYALGLNPNEASREGLPAGEVRPLSVDGVTADYLTLEFKKPDAVTDVGYSVKSSSDLVTWPGEAVLESSVSNGDGTTTYLYRDSEPVGTASTRFMKLEVMILN